jgi:hypothetical protein
MNHGIRRLIFGIQLVAMLCSGCGSAGEHAAEAPSVPARAAATPSAPAPTAATPPHSPEVADKAAPPESIAQFRPPFPDRLDLFEPPKRAQSTVRRDDEGETVELKGFVHVDQPRVVLAIDGVISPIAEGGEKYGVQVISIQPPSVVLQRGRNRWTATLE